MEFTSSTVARMEEVTLKFSIFYKFGLLKVMSDFSLFSWWDFDSTPTTEATNRNLMMIISYIFYGSDFAGAAADVLFI
jgi:hypothetical protein